MSNRRPPRLRVPALGPLVRSTLFYDFSPPELESKDVDWDREVPVLIDHRLAAVAQRMLRDLGVRPPEPVARQLQDATFAWTQTSCLTSTRAGMDLEVLVGQDIPFVVTKGPGIASLTGRLAERPYSDIDVFVAADQFGQVQRLLARSGYHEETKNIVPWPGLGDVCREAVNLRSPAGGSVDVHHRIPPWLWGSDLRFADVLSHSQPLAVPGGAVLPCASPADNLLISALHIVSDKNSPGATLMAWRDVLVLAREADPNEVLQRAIETHLSGWVAWIMEALPPNTLPGGLVHSLAATDPYIPHRRRLGLVVLPGIASRHPVLGQLCRIPIGNALRYGAGLGWPSNQFLEAKMGQMAHPRLTWLRTLVLGEDDPGI